LRLSSGAWFWKRFKPKAATR